MTRRQRSWSPPAPPRHLRRRSWRFVNPGDEVIALEPFYDSYAASIELAGGQRVGVGLFGPDFQLDHAELAAAFTPKTKALLINSPHNPTGAVLDRADLSRDRGTGGAARCRSSSATRCMSI